MPKRLKKVWAIFTVHQKVKAISTIHQWIRAIFTSHQKVMAISTIHLKVRAIYTIHQKVRTIFTRWIVKIDLTFWWIVKYLLPSDGSVSTRSVVTEQRVMIRTDNITKIEKLAIDSILMTVPVACVSFSEKKIIKMWKSL
jgi:hypothetical protein